jgi:hypothetical protein
MLLLFLAPGCATQKGCVQLKTGRFGLSHPLKKPISFHTLTREGQFLATLHGSVVASREKNRLFSAPKK